MLRSRYVKQINLETDCESTTLYWRADKNQGAELYQSLLFKRIVLSPIHVCWSTSLITIY